MRNRRSSKTRVRWLKPGPSSCSAVQFRGRSTTQSETLPHGLKRLFFMLTRGTKPCCECCPVLLPNWGLPIVAGRVCVSGAGHRRWELKCMTRPVLEVLGPSFTREISEPHLHAAMAEVLCLGRKVVVCGSRHPMVLNADVDRWRTGSCSRARIVCLGGGDDKRDAARKALEAALGEKQDKFKQWDEEIKKKESGGNSGGKGRGRGWGGGGSEGGGRSPDAGGSNAWNEALQIVYAFTGLTALYLVLTQGKSILAVILNSVLYVSRGFKNPSRGRNSPAMASIPERSPGSAESNVRRKWGSN